MCETIKELLIVQLLSSWILLNYRLIRGKTPQTENENSLFSEKPKNKAKRYTFVESRLPKNSEELT